jgi:hypothetical protein
LTRFGDLATLRAPKSGTVIGNQPLAPWSFGMNRTWMGLVLGLSVGIVGCGGGSGASEPAAGGPEAAGEQAASTEAGATEAAPVPAAPAVQVPADAGPDKVVTVFLDALKNGDTSTKASLLTAKALAETTKHEFEVNPQSAPNAQYQVHPPEFLASNPNGAHVTSVWTESYEDGQITYEVVWVLRRETQGWRIAGMAIELIPNQPPSFLNFEDPADMAAKYNEAMAAQQPPAAETAANPQDPMAIQSTPIER